jgi:SAM-dependent methyltransferase
MKRRMLEILCCPECRGDLHLTLAVEHDSEVESGSLSCAGCAKAYEIARSVPRFVPSQNYAGSFGIQWNLFRRTQLDSQTGVPCSRERFIRQTGWPPDLAGKRVLDVGCGAGRFAEVALSFGADLIALDYSSAVDACLQNCRSPNLDAVQGDIFQLPFKEAAFDFVYCFGVLQHTPDPERALCGLASQLRPDGRLAVDVYPKLFLNTLWPKYWLRPITRRLPPERLLRLVNVMVRLLLPVSVGLRRIPVAGHKLSYLVPVANYQGVYPLSRSQLREWAILDTFDMLAPAHDHPQSAAMLRSCLKRSGLKQIEVFRSGFLVARAVK